MRIVQSDIVPIHKLFGSFYVESAFQRGYKWREEQAVQFMQDILNDLYDERGNLVPDPDNTHGSYLGSIHCSPNKDQSITIMDGQQRIITSLLVLCALRDRLIELGETTDNIDTLRVQIIDKKPNPLTGRDEPTYRIRLQFDNVNRVFESLARGDIPNEKKVSDNSSKNLIKVYNTVYSILKDRFGDSIDDLHRFKYSFTHRVRVTQIMTQSEVDGWEVFNRINTRGIRLDASDKLKGLLYNYMPPEDRPYLIEAWSSFTYMLERDPEITFDTFLMHWLMSETGNENIKKYAVYEEIEQEKHALGLAHDARKFLEDLVEAGRVYRNLVDANSPDGTPNEGLQNIKQFKTSASQHRILLLAARHLDKEAFELLSRWCENVMYISLINNVNPSDLRTWFSRWSKVIRQCQSVADVHHMIAHHIKPILRKMSPTFRGNLELRHWATVGQSSRFTRYHLAKLNEYVSRQLWGDEQGLDVQQALKSKPTLEHIGAQSSEESWVHRLGNLTLLEESINKSIQDSNFTKKSAEFCKSRYSITSILCPDYSVGKNSRVNRFMQEVPVFSYWNEDAVILREQWMHNIASKVWGIEE